MARRLGLLFVLGLAVMTKLAVLLSLGSHPLLQPDAGLDTGAYVRLAWRVASGDFLLGTEPYFVSPLYVYFLAAILKVTASSLFPVRLVQVLLGTAAAGLVFATALRLFGERAAIAAGLLYVLTGVVTFHEVLILQAALDPFLTALALYLLAAALTREEDTSKGREEKEAEGRSRLPGTWAAAGVAFGLLALNRPNALLAVAAVGLTLALAPPVARRRGSLPSPPFEEISLRTFLPVAAFVFGVVLAIAPVTLRNLAVSHEFVLISSHGGLNFFIGNNPEADGTYRAVPGITPSIEGQAADTKRVAEAEAGRPLSVREVSEHFAAKARRWIASSPGAAGRLFARKVWYVLSGDEIPLNFSFPWYRQQSPPLKFLAVGPGLLVPLGGAGLVLLLLGAGRLRPPDAAPWAVFAPAYVLSVAAFFVATRYRLPLFVPLAVAAGGALAAVLESKARRHLVPAGVVAALLAFVALRPTGLWDGASDEEMHLVLWEIEKGDAGAMRHAESAGPAHSDPALFWLRVGESFDAAGKPDEAIAALSRSHEIAPDRPGTASVLSSLLEKRGLARALSGDTAGARPDLEEAVRLDEKNAAACLNLAVVLAEAGETDRARALTRQALTLKPDYEKARALLKALDRMK
jgi:4-amino-4-deoxy-L-arabinose transferase-like glycosyltransferase